MVKGKILTINADKGFGFIKPAAGGADIFFHCSAVDADFSTLKTDQVVDFEVDDKAEKPRASKVVTGTSSPRSTASTYEGTNPHRGKKPESSRPAYKPDNRRGGSGNRSGGSDNRSGGYQGSKPNSSYTRSPRPPREEINYVFGYVTKLPRKKKSFGKKPFVPKPFGSEPIPIKSLIEVKPFGYISSVEGGPEYYFDPLDVLGEKKFDMLAVGDYVRFVGKPNPDDPKQPFAREVEVVPKLINRQENNLARHPKARRRKPTWRS